MMEDYEDDYKPMNRWKGRAMVIFRIVYSLVVPTFVFRWIYFAVAKEWHRYDVEWTWGFAFGAWIFVFLNFTLFTAARAVGRRFDAKWQLFNTLQLAAAILAGTYFGNKFYQEYFTPLMDFKALEPYVNVNPVKDTGDMFLDAGQLYFKEGSHVDTTRTTAFKNFDVYCIAPIIRDTLEDEGLTHDTGTQAIQMPESGTIDFFAVGVNCCDATGENFNCGAIGGDARSGLRVLEAEHRPFYSMAAESWAMTYKIPAKHPVFVKWTVDPLGDIGGMDTAAGKLYAKMVKRDLQFNIVCLLFFLVVFEGYEYWRK